VLPVTRGTEGRSSTMTDTITSEPDASQTKRNDTKENIFRPGLVGGLVCAILAILATVVYMGHAATDCTSDVRGAPGDGTNGSVWLNFAWNETGGLPTASTQHETGAPIGDALWRPETIVNSSWALPMWAAAKITGPVCGYNLTIAFGHVSSAVAMYALAWYVTRSRLSSIMAGLLFGFSAFAQLKSEGHLSGVFLSGFPLLLLALLVLWKHPRPRNVVLTALAWTWLAYTDGYYLPFSLWLVTMFTLGAVVADIRAAIRDGTVDRLVRRLIAVACAGAITLVLLIPWLISILGNRGELVRARGRTLFEADVYSARPLEYLVPAQSHPFFYPWSAGWRLSHLHGSNAVESTIFLGYIPVALALFWLLGRRWWTARQSPIGDTQRLASFAFVFVAAGAFVASLSPLFKILGVAVPMPSRVLWELFPALRGFSRFFVVVSAATIAVAAMGLSALCARFSVRWTRVAIAAAITTVGLFESLAINPRHPPTWSFDQSPAAYRETAKDDTVKVVAVYPLTSPAEVPENAIFTFQVELDRPLLNAVTDPGGADDAAGIARGLASLTDPQTLPALRALGVDTVFVERELLGPKPSALDGLELQKSYDYWRDDSAHQSNGGPMRWAYLGPYYDVDLYRVLPGPVAPAVVTLGDGWFGPEGNWSTSRWMGDDGEVFVRDVGAPDDEVEVSFMAAAFATDRELVVLDGTNEIARFHVPASEPREFQFVAPVGHALTFRSSPPADPVVKYNPASADPRSISITVSGWDVRDVAASS